MYCLSCSPSGPLASVLRPNPRFYYSIRQLPTRHSFAVNAMQDSQKEGEFLMQRFTIGFAKWSCATAISLAMAFHPPAAQALDTVAPSRQLDTASSDVPLNAPFTTSQVNNDTPFLDLARVVPAGKIDAIQNQLRQLEQDTGYKVRVLTRFGPSDTPSVDQIRSGWGVDDRTVVVFVDPSAPSILSFKYGRSVQDILHRPFFTELQSRYGNIYFVRENGEQAAVDGMLGALDVCLRKGGCAVPPGLPQEQYYFTLATAISGGLILGSVLRIEPQGFVSRRWVYGLLFAPLWATLSINFGIGPIVSRTDDVLPVAANVVATIASALLIYYYPQAAKATGLSLDEPMNSDWE